jgi:hypothetical protein
LPSPDGNTPFRPIIRYATLSNEAAPKLQNTIINYTYNSYFLLLSTEDIFDITILGSTCKLSLLGGLLLHSFNIKATYQFT